MTDKAEKPKKPRKEQPSLRKAINDECKECIYDQHGGRGTWRQQVEACTATGCPLYPLRPVSATEAAEEAE